MARVTSWVKWGMDADSLQKVLKGNAAVREQHFKESERFLNSALSKLKLEAGRKGITIITSTQVFPHIKEGFVVANLAVHGIQPTLATLVGVQQTAPGKFAVLTNDLELPEVSTEAELIAVLFTALQKEDDQRTEYFVKGSGNPGKLFDS